MTTFAGIIAAMKYDAIAFLRLITSVLRIQSLRAAL